MVVFFGSNMLRVSALALLLCAMLACAHCYDPVYELTFIGAVARDLDIDAVTAELQANYTNAVATAMGVASDRVSLQVSGSIPYVEMAFAIRYDDAAQLDAAYNAFSRFALNAAIGESNIFIGWWGLLRTCPSVPAGATSNTPGSCLYSCQDNKTSINDAACSCDTGYHSVYIEPPAACEHYLENTPADSVFDCPQGNVHGMGSFIIPPLFQFTLALPVVTGGSPYASVAVSTRTQKGSDVIEGLVFEYDGSGFVIIGYAIGEEVIPLTDPPAGVFTGLNFVYNASTKTVTTTYYYTVTIELQDAELSIHYTDLGPLRYLCLTCADLSPADSLVYAEECSSTPGGGYTSMVCPAGTYSGGIETYSQCPVNQTFTNGMCSCLPGYYIPRVQCSDTSNTFTTYNWDNQIPTSCTAGNIYISPADPTVSMAAAYEFYRNVTINITASVSSTSSATNMFTVSDVLGGNAFGTDGATGTVPHFCLDVAQNSNFENGYTLLWICWDGSDFQFWTSNWNAQTLANDYTSLGTHASYNIHTSTYQTYQNINVTFAKNLLSVSFMPGIQYDSRHFFTLDVYLNYGTSLILSYEYQNPVSCLACSELTPGTPAFSTNKCTTGVVPRVCTPCSGGTYSASGATTCTACTAGTSSPPGSSGCISPTTSSTTHVATTTSSTTPVATTTSSTTPVATTTSSTTPVATTTSSTIHVATTTSSTIHVATTTSSTTPVPSTSSTTTTITRTNSNTPVQTTTSSTTPVPSTSSTTSTPPVTTSPVTTGYQIIFTSNLAYNSPADFSKGLQLLYQKAVISTIGGMDPEGEFNRVSLVIAARARRRLLAGTVDVATTVSLDNASQMESAAGSVNANSLGAALSRYSIVLLAMSAVESSGGLNRTSTSTAAPTTSIPTSTPGPQALDSLVVGLAVGGGLLLWILLVGTVVYLCCYREPSRENVDDEVESSLLMPKIHFDSKFV